MRINACLRSLQSNSIFNVLSAENVKRQPIEVDKAFEPVLPDGSPSGIEVLPFEVPGKGAWYLEGKAHPAGGDGAGDTLGLRILDKVERQIFLFPGRLRARDRRSEVAACGRGAGVFRRHGLARRRIDRSRARHQDGTRHGPHFDVGRSRRDREPCRPRHRPEDVLAYQQLQPGAAARLGRAQDRRSRRAGTFPPTERRSRCECRRHDWNDRTIDRQGHHAQQRRGTGSDAAPYRRDALSQPAPVPPAAARRQAQQGPGAGLGAEPLLLPEHDPAEGRDGDLAVPRPRHPHRMAAPDRGSRRRYQHRRRHRALAQADRRTRASTAPMWN